MPQQIYYATQVTPLGRALLAATDQGLCLLNLGGADEREDRAALAAAFADMEAVPEDAAIAPYAAALLAFLAGDGTEYRPRLDIRCGTPFQRAVWAELQEIPAGQTVTYTQLAERLGRPAAVRAVAGACAQNVLAIAIPCHRVIRADGSLSGYRWGIERKRQLLRLEGAEPPALALSPSISVAPAAP